MSVPLPSKKNVTLSTKVSIDEAAVLTEKAKQAGLTVSALVRQAAIDGQVQPRTVIPQINQEHWADLARMGANLNQIASRLNEGGPVDAHLSTLLDDNRKLLTDVRAALIGAEVSHGG